MQLSENRHPSWFKALSFATVTRTISTLINNSKSPLLTKVPHDCKILYIWRDPKVAFVSLWHFINKLRSDKCCEDNISLGEAFELFSNGISYVGPYWSHVQGYWKASLEHPERILFLKYEEMMEDTVFYLKRLTNFVGYPSSLEEVNEGVVQKILESCAVRRGKVGDWKNYLTCEMGQRLDKIMESKLSGAGLK